MKASRIVRSGLLVLGALLSSACTKLPPPENEYAGLEPEIVFERMSTGSAIPVEYGDFVGVTIHPRHPDLAQLWFKSRTRRSLSSTWTTRRAFSGPRPSPSLESRRRPAAEYRISEATEEKTTGTENVLRFVYRVLFAGSFVVAGLGVWEKLANLSGYTVVRGACKPGRLSELSAVPLSFAIALLLRQIRDDLRKAS